VRLGIERVGFRRKSREIVWIQIDVIVLRHSAGTGTKRTPIGGHLRAALPVCGKDYPLF
jgi:hypothetical protein